MQHATSAATGGLKPAEILLPSHALVVGDNANSHAETACSQIGFSETGQAQEPPIRRITGTSDEQLNQVTQPDTEQATERYSINDCRVIYLPRIQDQRGNLTFIEADRHIPFAFKRTYYLYDVPGGSERGAHAHKDLHQFIVAMSGSFDIILDDGDQTKRIHLNRSYYGLYMCPMIWHSMENFSSGSVCMVLSSEYYNESDYIRDYTEFHHASRAA